MKKLLVAYLYDSRSKVLRGYFDEGKDATEVSANTFAKFRYVLIASGHVLVELKLVRKRDNSELYLGAINTALKLDTLQRLKILDTISSDIEKLDIEEELREAIKSFYHDNLLLFAGFRDLVASLYSFS